MITLDSIKLAIPMTASSSLDGSWLLEIRKTDASGRLVEHALTRRSTELGIGPIRLDLFESVIIVELSAKSLRERYSEMISIETIGLVLERLSDVGVVLDIAQTLDEALILTCNVATDLQVDDPGDAVLAVTAGLYDGRYWREPHGRESMIFRNKSRRISFYDKAHELTLAKNRELCSVIVFPAGRASVHSRSDNDIADQRGDVPARREDVGASRSATQSTGSVRREREDRRDSLARRVECCRSACSSSQ